MAQSYFALEVFAQEVVLHASVPLPEPAPDARAGPCALAFQFLDYPLLLVHASVAPGRAVTASGHDARLLAFGAGKACVVQANEQELGYLLDEVPLYASLLNMRSQPSPTTLGTGATPLLITAPTAQDAQHPPGSGLAHAVVRAIDLHSPSGELVGVARISCRLTSYGSRVPPLATPGHAASHRRPATAPAPALTAAAPPPAHAALTERAATAVRASADAPAAGARAPAVRQAWPDTGAAQPQGRGGAGARAAAPPTPGQALPPPALFYAHHTTHAPEARSAWGSPPRGAAQGAPTAPTTAWATPAGRQAEAAAQDGHAGAQWGEAAGQGGAGGMAGDGVGLDEYMEAEAAAEAAMGAAHDARAHEAVQQLEGALRSMQRAQRSGAGGGSAERRPVGGAPSRVRVGPKPLVPLTASRRPPARPWSAGPAGAGSVRDGARARVRPRTAGATTTTRAQQWGPSGGVRGSAEARGGRAWHSSGAGAAGAQRWPGGRAGGPDACGSEAGGSEASSSEAGGAALPPLLRALVRHAATSAALKAQQAGAGAPPPPAPLSLGKGIPPPSRGHGPAAAAAAPPAPGHPQGHQHHHHHPHHQHPQWQQPHSHPDLAHSYPHHGPPHAGPPPPPMHHHHQHHTQQQQQPQQQGAFQQASIMMWEVMSLVAMRSVLTSALGAMHTQMAGMAHQLVAQAVAPAAGLLGSLAGVGGLQPQQQQQQPLQQQQQMQMQQQLQQQSNVAATLAALQAQLAGAQRPQAQGPAGPEAVGASAVVQQPAAAQQGQRTAQQDAAATGPRAVAAPASVQQQQQQPARVRASPSTSSTSSSSEAPLQPATRPAAPGPERGAAAGAGEQGGPRGAAAPQLQVQVQAGGHRADSPVSSVSYDDDFSSELSHSRGGSPRPSPHPTAAPPRAAQIAAGAGEGHSRLHAASPFSKGALEEIPEEDHVSASTSSRTRRARGGALPTRTPRPSTDTGSVSEVSTLGLSSSGSLEGGAGGRGAPAGAARHAPPGAVVHVAPSANRWPAQPGDRWVASGEEEEEEGGGQEGGGRGGARGGGNGRRLARGASSTYTLSDSGSLGGGGSSSGEGQPPAAPGRVSFRGMEPGGSSGAYSVSAEMESSAQLGASRSRHSVRRAAEDGDMNSGTSSSFFSSVAHSIDHGDSRSSSSRTASSASAGHARPHSRRGTQQQQHGRGHGPKAKGGNAGAGARAGGGGARDRGSPEGSDASLPISFLSSSEQESIDITGSIRHSSSLTPRGDRPRPPPIAARRDSLAFSIMTTDDISDLSGSIEFEMDGDDIVAGLDSPQAAMEAARRRSSAGRPPSRTTSGRQRGAAGGQQPQRQASQRQRAPQRYDSESMDMGQTADILDAISGMSSIGN